MTMMARTHIHWTWHAGQWTAVVLTGGLWLPFYLIKWMKKRRPHTEYYVQPHSHPYYPETYNSPFNSGGPGVR